MADQENARAGGSAFAAQTGFTAPSISLPKGGGAVRGIGEKFAPNPATGTGSLTIPIALSPVRNGFGPSLSLSYDSGTGNGPFGVGWSVTSPSITRKTEKGTPRYVDDDGVASDVYILSGSEDLVPVLEQSDAGDWIPVEGERDGHRIKTYRPRVEGVFARIERWTRISDGDIHWRSIARDNIVSVYGDSSESRIADPHNPSRVFSWLICRSHDDRGNAIVYEYAGESDNGVDLSKPSEHERTCSANRYPKRVLYGNRRPLLLDPSTESFRRSHTPAVATDTADWMFEAIFDYGDEGYVQADADERGREYAWIDRRADGLRPVRRDPFSTYRSGFEIRTYRLCQRVLMYHRFPRELGTDRYLVRSTELAYDEKAIGSFVTRVVQSGFRLQPDGRYLKKSMPPLDLAYSASPLERGDVEDYFVKEADAGVVSSIPGGVDGANLQWVDLDAEGISGVLTEQATAWFYRANLGGGHFGPAQVVMSKPSTQGIATGGQQLLDIDGDGLIDVVDFGGRTPGFYERTTDAQFTPFQPFRSWPLRNWSDPNLRFADVTGDGLSDVLVTEDDALIWHASLGKDGFAEGVRVRVPNDEERGPRVMFADGTQSLYLADMSGDGAPDLVRIRNGEVCYWPNLGYGRFGPKVTMDHSPWFDHPELFDHRRIRLADTDGSGTTDIIYFATDAARIFLNESGNGWSAARSVRHFPPLTTQRSASVVDLLGRGTACLVWSSPLPADASRPLRYLDLMAGRKPHLLTTVVNNLGTRLEIEYASSAEIALADKAAGHSWITRLPFPVHVITRTTTFDQVSRNRFVTRYSYHHGHFDGDEREFRGFGRVDQVDTEELDVLESSTSNAEPRWRTPPVLTRTWFHTGAFLNGARISKQLAYEYYREPDHPETMELRDTVLPDWLEPDETREACRALAGLMLRQEIYALDESDESSRPYKVQERNYTVRREQPRGGNRFAVFFSHAREALAFDYERKLYPVDGRLRPDPRVSHALTLSVDRYGSVLQTATIGYGRRFPDSAPYLTEADRARQRDAHLTVREDEYTNAVDLPDAFRTPLLAQSRGYELIHARPQARQPGVTNLYRFDEVERLVAAAGDGRHDLPFEDIDAIGARLAAPYRRLLDASRTLYRSNDMSGLLPLGRLESLAQPGESYRLAFTSGLLSQVYGDRLPDTAAVLAAQGGYLDLDGRADWWTRSGQVFASPGEHDPPETELAFAVENFFLPWRFQDPFGNTTVVRYDDHHLAAIETRDAAGNISTYDNDYRVLAPRRAVDSNGNRSEVAFDTLGLVVGTSVMGKPGEQSGDSLEGFDPDLDPVTELEHIANPLTEPDVVLGNATTRLIYDLAAFVRAGAPAVSYSLTRETHAADLPSGARTRIHHAFSYSDGFGREIQRKVQAEAGSVDGSAAIANPRWTGTGWVIFNNKGKPVRQYEPFFSGTHRFEFATVVGVSSTLFYDPVGRVVAKLHPEHTYEKAVFDPWRQETWDVNDTVLDDPAGDPDVGAFFRHLPESEFRPTWFDARRRGASGESERGAATQAAAHARTPVVDYADSLGRTFLSIAHNRMDNRDAQVDERYLTRVEYDVQGNTRAVVDALGRTIAGWAYDAIGRRTFQRSLDAGNRWLVPDVAGQPLLSFDSRSHRIRREYDALRRVVGVFVRAGDGVEQMAQRIEYGESRPDAQAANLRGRVVRQFDAAGVVTNERYDFKGNLLRVTRQLLSSYRDQVDWSTSPALEPETFAAETRFDALNRPIEMVAPDDSVIRPVFNEGHLLEQLHVRLPGAADFTRFVTRIDYNARGERETVEYGNGVRTVILYDPATFRVRESTSVRAADGALLQGYTYTYDPIGNVTSVIDSSQQTIYFKNAAVSARRVYAYDGLYRLRRASGREHAGSPAQPQTTHDDLPRIHHPLPGDAQALRTYREEYRYDAVGNILSLVHEAAGERWVRSYHYDRLGNRLDRTTLGSVEEPYAYDGHGNTTRMPHLPSLVWDFKDQLVSTCAHAEGDAEQESVYYVYDGSGQRVRKIRERRSGRRSCERIYLGGFEIYREYDNDAVRLERRTLHVMDDKRRLAIVDSTEHQPPAIRYQLDDRLGNSCVELDEAGAVVSFEEYYPYGGTSYQGGRSVSEVSLKRYRYTGKERDEETGFYYNSARYLAPWLGRWVSCDPTGLADGPNLYEYAASNPIGRIDPSGTQNVDPSREETYAEGVDDATGAHESYAVTPELESHQYVEFQEDQITASKDKPKPPTPSTPNSSTKAQERIIILDLEPFDEQAWLADIGNALKQMDTPEYKLSRLLAEAERQRQAEFEAEERKEAELDKKLPGLGESLVPIWGSGKSSYIHFTNGNYGRGIVYGVLAVTDVFLVKSLVVGGGKLVMKGAGSLALAGGRGGAAKAALRGGGEEGIILFGQKRVAPQFRTIGSPASDAIRGQTLVDVAEGLKAGKISPSELPIEYFIDQSGRRVAVNNRGLAALRMAGMEPTIVKEVPATAELLGRLAEKPIDRFHLIPGLRLAVTTEKSGAGHLYTVIAR